MMRFRFGLIIGFAVGYYFGTRAGRERYEEIQRWIRKAKSSELYEVAEEKAKDLVHHGEEDTPGRVSAPGSVSETFPSDLPG